MQEVKAEKPKPVLPPIPTGFVQLKELGRGNFAGVVLGKYVVTDQEAEAAAEKTPDKVKVLAKHQEIKSLCDPRGFIAIKLTLKPDPHEAEIAQYLYDQAKQNSNQTGLYNLSVPYGDALICQYVSYDDALDPPKSSNVESFIRNVSSNKGSSNSPDKIANAFHANVGVSLSQLANSAYGSIAHMHAEKVIHLDLATRNLFVNKPTYDASGNVVSFTTTIGDYGLSEKLSEEGNFTPPEGVRIRSPMRWASSNITDYNMADVSSDLFATKALTIGMTGLALGAVNESDVLALTESNEMKDFIAARFGDGPYAGNDEKVLTKYLSNVSQLLEQCPDKKKSVEMEIFIECYREFLTTMPSSAMTNKEAQQADHDLLMKTNAKYIMKVFETKLQQTDFQTPDQVNELSLLARRLQSIEVSGAFKDTEFYKKLTSHAISPEQKINQEQLLDKVEKAGEAIKKQLGPYKWAFITGEAMGNHPRALLGQILKGEVEKLKQDVRDGKITSLENIDTAIKGMQDRLVQVNEPGSQKNSIKQTTSTLNVFKQTTAKNDEVEAPRINMRR